MKLILTSIFLLSATSSIMGTPTIHRIPIKYIQNLTLSNSQLNLIQVSCQDISNSFVKFGITEVLCNNLENPIDSNSIINNCQLEYTIELEHNDNLTYKYYYKLIFCIVMILFYIVVTFTACYQLHTISNNFDMSRTQRGYISPTRLYRVSDTHKNK